MRKLFTLRILLLPVILFGSLSPNIGLGQTAAWNTFGQTAYGTQGLAPITKDANVTVVGLTRASGVTTTPTAAGNVWGGNGWSAVSFANAITNNKFITFSITPNTGYKMSLSSINPFIIRISATGPINILIQYQVGSGSFTDIATRSVTRPSSTSNFTLSSIDLSSISDLQNVSPGTSITFRLVPYSSTSTAGVFYIGNQLNANSLVINGTVSSAISNDATLSGLTLSSGTLTPGFTTTTTSYGASVASNVSSIIVTPVVNEGHATITVNGGSPSSPVSLSVGDNTITTIVTAQDGTTTKTYTVIVNRATPGVPDITASSLTDFGNVCINNTAGPNSFTVNGVNLDGSNSSAITVNVLPGFSYSETEFGTYTNTLNFTYTSDNFSGKIIYVKFNPTAVQSYNGNINVSGGGASRDVPASGTGVNTGPSVTNGNSSAVTATTAILTDTITVAGCTAVTSYGFEYSLNSGFANGTGTQVLSSNLSGGIFSATVTGLTPNQQYFYKAFAANSSVTTYGTQRSFINAPLPVVMAFVPGLSYTEDFHDIANWSNFFISGDGANHFDGLSTNATGTIPDGIKLTASTNSFASGSSGGVQKGTDQSPSTQSIVLLSTGASPENSSSAAIDFYLDFTGVNAGTLSFDWASINNSTGDRKGSLRVYGSTNGTTFTEIPAADVLNFTNNNPTNGSVLNIQLPASFNNSSTARLRFYYSNGTGGTTGSRPKISIDNLTVTAVPSTPCTIPTAQPTSMVFGTITDVSIQGSFSAASPASDQYLTVVSTNSSLTSNPIDGVTYNIGDALGDGTVIAKGSSLNFTATSLSPATIYYFFTFAVNGVCTGGPKYFTDNPLVSSTATNSPLPSCIAPSAQAGNLVFGNVNVNSIQGSFTATTADEYLVLVSTASSLTNAPVNGVIYNTGDALGNATVVQRNTGTSFTANGLAAGTQYYFFVYSLNSQNCINGPTYSTTEPLSGSQTTQPLPPCVNPSSQPTLFTFNAANTSISGTFNGTNSADDYLIIRSTSSTLSSLPVDNVDYNVGTSLGGGIVIANSSATSFITNNLNTGTLYYFFVFAANKNCSGGTKYLTISPLTGSATTTNFAQNNYYFGTLHSHSDYSDGNQDHPGFTPTDDYNYAMTAQCMDFLGISEHNHFSSANNPGNTITNYHQGSIEANTFTSTHSNFLALYGMEWGVISGGGHIVVYGDGMDKLFGWESGNGGWGPTNNYDVYVPKSVYTGPVGLFKTVNDFKDQNTFATLAHPNQTDFNNLAGVAYDVVADSAIVGSAVESGPATTTNKTYSNPGSPMFYLWYYQTLLSKGYHLGPTIDHDNHNTTFGHTTYSRTAVIAPALTKTDLIKAMHDMHFYATQDCDSKVDFTINTRMMGSVFSDRNAPSISVTLSDATTSTSSAIIRVMYGRPGSGAIAAKIDSVIGNTLYFVDDNLAIGATGYYYIDITNGSSRIITSPIWYTRTCSIESNSTVYSCNSYDWNGQTYTESGTYSKTGFTSILGCDSTAILHLTITTPTTGDTTAVACNSFTWYGDTYFSSGTATHVLKERGGCDSTVTLHLTINHSSTSTTDVTACDRYTWNGNEYTITGQYLYHTLNSVGCDSTATLNLTIHHSSTSSETITACDSYTWHDIPRTSSGDYTFESVNAEGCTNTATLHLTINHSSTSSETVVACDSYTWHATPHTSSGDYTFESVNEEGCTNTATLHLTINHSSTSSETITACGSYTWNGTVYTSSGNYIYLSTNAQGCINTATLHLTINPKPSVAIPSVIVLPSGVNANTVYIGYAPASILTVSANPAAGTPAYSYSWSAGTGLSIVSGTANQQSVQIFATGSGNYSSTLTVTVTDSKGCTATATATIYVLDIRSGNHYDKVTVCHNGNTLSVSASAIQAHLNHGDRLGSCTSIITSARILNSQTVSAKSISGSPVESGSYTLSNYPNPFNTSTVISYYVPVDSKVSLKIYNALGQAVTTLFNGDKKAGSYTVTFNASKLINGFYYCKLVALSNKQQFVQSIKLAVGK